MDGSKKFLRDESGTAEAASSVAIIGMLSSALSGALSLVDVAWTSVGNHPAGIFLGVFVLLFIFWIVIKA
jgi:Flp pilus assembly pilin Flp